MANNSYRLIVCFDIDAASLYDAYGELVKVLGVKKAKLMWETADEWYSDEDEDDEGPGDVHELISTITQYYDEHPKVDG